MRQLLPARLVVLMGLSLFAGSVLADSAQCDAAIQNYEELRARSVMDESQYASTVEAHAVRLYCTGQTEVSPKADQSQPDIGTNQQQGRTFPSPEGTSAP